jgi:hypothetical protein
VAWESEGCYNDFVGIIYHEIGRKNIPLQGYFSWETGDCVFSVIKALWI